MKPVALAGGAENPARMECPRCRTRATEAASYREAPRAEHGVALSPVVHASGQTVETCSACGGGFVENAALIAIERWGRRAVGRADASEIARRAYARARDPIDCPRCDEGMIGREWRFATLVFVDVCPECRGVWLDPGELAQIESS